MGGLKMKLLINNNHNHHHHLHNYDYESDIEQGNEGDKEITDTSQQQKKSFPFFLGSTVSTEWTIMNDDLERKEKKRKVKEGKGKEGSVRSLY
jgi:hypothetical protein